MERTLRRRFPGQRETTLPNEAVVRVSSLLEARELHAWLVAQCIPLAASLHSIAWTALLCRDFAATGVAAGQRLSSWQAYRVAALSQRGRARMLGVRIRSALASMSWALVGSLTAIGFCSTDVEAKCDVSGLSVVLRAAVDCRSLSLFNPAVSGRGCGSGSSSSTTAARWLQHLKFVDTVGSCERYPLHCTLVSAAGTPASLVVVAVCSGLELLAELSTYTLRPFPSMPRAASAAAAAANFINQKVCDSVLFNCKKISATVSIATGGTSTRQEMSAKLSLGSVFFHRSSSLVKLTFGGQLRRMAPSGAGPPAYFLHFCLTLQGPVHHGSGGGERYLVAVVEHPHTCGARAGAEAEAGLGGGGGRSSGSGSGGGGGGGRCRSFELASPLPAQEAWNNSVEEECDEFVETFYPCSPVQGCGIVSHARHVGDSSSSRFVSIAAAAQPFDVRVVEEDRETSLVSGGRQRTSYRLLRRSAGGSLRSLRRDDDAQLPPNFNLEWKSMSLHSADSATSVGALATYVEEEQAGARQSCSGKHVEVMVHLSLLSAICGRNFTRAEAAAELPRFWPPGRGI